ncbi:hypothetical protein HYW74_04530 [Candidatus Pacearchaeota archaeon]|nr:hypothetical protein [Candidatus Pacearchaeota archaeon]
MDKLTLGDCLTQERGYEGRLFQITGIGIGENGERGNVRVYRILKHDEAVMSIEGYVVGGTFKNLENIPINDERKKDNVMDSDLLMEWYRLAGIAGKKGFLLS